MNERLLTMDQQGYDELVECAKWVESRPFILYIEPYEIDSSQVKMIGHLIDHIYEEIEIDDFFKRVYMNGDTLIVTDYEDNDWRIEVRLTDV